VSVFAANETFLQGETALTPGKVFWRGLLLAALVATLATIWIPAEPDFSGLLPRLSLPLPVDTPAAAPLQPTRSAATSARIGLVAGHWGNDSGAVCPNGTTEVDINLRVATLVQQSLLAEGYQVDLLQEFDPKLQDYRATALVSIHSDSCDYRGPEATGYKIARASNAYDSNLTFRLLNCLRDRYAQATGLTYHPNTITIDMSEYHAFDEVAPTTPAVIIEIGFMNLDYDLLTQHPDVVARGITSGILCYVRNESLEP
jgi:N-acetylmuramoyl-L-alanine amidase